MHILYYSTSYHANHGGSIQSIEFYNQLNKNPEVSKLKLFPEISKKPTYVTDSNFSIKKILRKIPLLQILFFYRRNNFYMTDLLRTLKKETPDVLIMQIDSNFLQIKKIKKAFPNILICTQINGSPFDEPFKNIGFPRLFHKIQKRSYSLSDLNFFISEFSRKRIMGSFLKTERDIVIYNGTDPDKFFPIKNKLGLRKKWNYPENALILGYIGTLDYHKQLELLVDVYAELLKEFPNLILVIVGDGPAFSKLLVKVKKLKLEDKIFFKGWIKHELVNEQLNCFDVAVHHYASAYMNPLKIFEYLSAGLPVVAPNIPSVTLAFKDHQDLLITGSQFSEVKKTIKEIISDKELREKLGNNQSLIKEMKDNYTWEKYAERILYNINSKLNK